MTLHDDLLPSNATPFEQELARLSGRLDEIDPAIIETIWDAWRCPVEILDHLAAALSVDFWDDGWSEVVKRQAVADSPRYHRLKGTRGGVEMLLGTLGYRVEIAEWWETVPWGRRGTFRVLIDLGSVPAGQRYTIGKSIRDQARHLVMMSKPKSRAAHIGIGEVAPGDLIAGIGVLVTRSLVLEPYRLVQPVVTGDQPVSTAMTSLRTLSVVVAPDAYISERTPRTGPLWAAAGMFVSRTLTLEAA